MASSILNSVSERRILVSQNIFAEDKTQRRQAKSYFLQEQEKSLNHFIDSSKDIYKKSTDLFSQNYQTQTLQLRQQKSKDLKKLIDRNSKQFQAYCLLKRKVDHKKDVIKNFTDMIYNKNLLKAFFLGWKTEVNAIQYRKKLAEKADQYYENRIKKNVLKFWQKIVINNNRMRIKNQVLRKTQLQVGRIQKEYEKIIQQLEKTLESKLIMLKRQEQQHKLLHDKYERMYSRKSC